MTGGGDALSLRLPEGKTDEVVKLLQDKYPGRREFKMLSHERVGAIVGGGAAEAGALGGGVRR